MQAVSFPGDTRENILHGESLEKVCMVDGGVRTPDPQKHGPADDDKYEGAFLAGSWSI